MLVLQCRVDSIISLLGKYSRWRQPQQSPGAEDTVMMSWVHISAGETVSGESRPLECLQTETKTCIVWRTGIWGGIVFVWLGSAHTVCCAVCFVWEGGRRLKQSSLFISAYSKWLRTACFNLHQAALARLFPSSPSDGSQLSPTQSSFEWQWLNQPRSHACFYTTASIVC